MQRFFQALDFGNIIEELDCPDNLFLFVSKNRRSYSNRDFTTIPGDDLYPGIADGSVIAESVLDGTPLMTNICAKNVETVFPESICGGKSSNFLGRPVE
jgi:hypothetical protein